MPKDVFRFSCPCCGKPIEVETRTGKARAVRPEERKGGGDLDQLVEKQKRESARLAGVFEQAREQQIRHKEILESLLEKAKREAKKEEERRPKHPFGED
ncbi:MAG: hypothetical protein Fur0037_28440 [Planctomycetota bacterium]